MPQLTDILKRKGQMEGDKQQLFIADRDFEFLGLPINKNALVYYNGKNEVKVNMIEYSLFAEHMVPEFLSKSLPESESGEYLPDLVGNCPNEDAKLGVGWRGIWHNNHFDKWNSSFTEYQDHVAQLPTLKYKGIIFSSLVYNFNPKSGELTYFINTESCKISIYGNVITLPKNLEISIEGKSATIIPIAENKLTLYSGMSFLGTLFILEDGTLTGEPAEFEANIHAYHKTNSIRVASDIQIALSGKMFIELYNDKASKTEKYKISQIK